MTNEQKFGRVEGIPEDEPCFVLRAKDNAAMATLLGYQQYCEQMGSPVEHHNAITDQFNRFAAWRREHPDLCKVPD